MSKPVTIAKIAEAMSVSSKTVNNYVKRGMPRDTVQAAIDWREQNVKKTPGPEPDEDASELTLKLKLAELQERLENARTRKLKNDQLAGLLIERAEVERDIAIAISRMSNKLRSLGTR